MPGERREDSRFGYTLVEIMIAVGLIAMLLAIAVPSFSKARTNSRIRKAESELQILSAAILQQAWDTGMWPGGLDRSVSNTREAWDLTPASCGLLATDNRFPSWKGPYLIAIPLDPWGMPYFFDPDYPIGGSDKVVVGSFGPNRKGRNLYDSDDIVVELK